MKDKKEPWYVYFVVAIFSGVITYFAFDNYDEFIHPDRLGSSRGSRSMLLILNVMDKIGGKWFVLVALSILTIYLLTRSYTQFKSAKK